MALTTVAVNGVTIEEMGLSALNLDEWLAPAKLRYGSVEPVGRIGTVATVRGSSWEPRELLLSVGTPDGETPAQARARIAAWYKALQGLLEIEVIDAPGRVCYGLFEGAKAAPFGTKLAVSTVEVVGRIVCRNPLWYDRNPDLVSAAAGVRVPVPVGSAPGIVKAAIIGAATDPTLTIRRRTGEVLLQLPFTVTLGATEMLEIDERATWPVTKWTAGVASDALATLATTATPVLPIDPTDGTTMEVDSGTLLVTTWPGHLT